MDAARRRLICSLINPEKDFIMNKLILLALGGIASAVFSATPAWAADSDAAAYRSASDKAAADYRSKKAECAKERGNEKQVCLQQAKVDRARADADAVEQHRNSPTMLSRARVALAHAEYGLARARCAVMTGNDKATCQRDAKATQTAALAEARSGARSSSMAANVEDCDKLEASAKTACLGRNKGDTSRGSMANTTERAGNAVSNTAEKAKDVAVDTARSTGKVVSDSVITTKIKADMARDPEVAAMDVHVETVKGVVMLSGFVNSQKEADRAVQLARSVEGVTEVKNGLKVK
jgi:hyperosmotically inducible periplasmic protein